MPSLNQASIITAEPLNDSVLDAVLALQLTVAWAGEGNCVPPRLNWWRTDLIDLAGGGCLLQDLLPKTYSWASLEAVREAATQYDRQMRQAMAEPDRLLTLFFWGFVIDEQLDDQLLKHKRSGQAPSEILPLPLELGTSFVAADLNAALSIPQQITDFRVTPSGREIVDQMPASIELCARNLASALLPLADHYPMPFYRLGSP